MTTAFVERVRYSASGVGLAGADQSRMCWLSGRFDDDTPWGSRPPTSPSIPIAGQRAPSEPASGGLQYAKPVL